MTTRQRLLIGSFNKDETQITRLSNIITFLNVQTCDELTLEEGDPPVPVDIDYFNIIDILHRICVKINNLEEA